MKFIHTDHPYGDVPPNGWANVNWTAQTEMTTAPSLSVTEIPCGGGMIRFEATVSDMVVETWYSVAPSFQLRQDELDHVNCFQQLYSEYENVASNINGIMCNCPSIANALLQSFLKRLAAAEISCAACNGKFDKPGGPHGH